MSTEEGEERPAPTCCISSASRTHILFKICTHRFSVGNKLIFGKWRFNHKLMKYSRHVTVCTSPTDSSRSQPLIIGFGSSENNSPPRANAVWRRRTRGEIIATAPASVRPRGSPKVRERSRYSLADTARASSEPPRAASVAPWLIPDAGEQRGRFVAHPVRPFPRAETRAQCDR